MCRITSVALICKELDSVSAEIHSAFHEIQMPRSPFQLEHFVVGQHLTEPMQYFQVVIELQHKYHAIKRGLVTKARAEREIRKLAKTRWYWPFASEFRCEELVLKKLESEQHNLALLGAVREADVLLKMWKSFGKKFTREEINADQKEYWGERLRRQAEQDLISTGAVGVGNQDAIRQAGIEPPSCDFIEESRAFEAVQ